MTFTIINQNNRKEVLKNVIKVKETEISYIFYTKGALTELSKNSIQFVGVEK